MDVSTGVTRTRRFAANFDRGPANGDNEGNLWHSVK